MNFYKTMATAIQNIHLLTRDIKFDRNELSGAFGDTGTVIPLLIGILLATGMDAGIVFIAYGVMQILTGLIYRIPMPVQPLKAVAVIVITQKLSADIMLCGGLTIGILMLILTALGVIDIFAKIIPKAVVRGIQFGLGLQLIMLAIKEYIPSERFSDYILVFISFLIVIMLLGNRRIPPALILIPAGIVYGIIFNNSNVINPQSHNYTIFNAITLDNMVKGFFILALPQISLSLGNSIYATSQLSEDLFAGKSIPPKKIALTYAFMNIVKPFFGGIPVCHGSGGMAGHYTFGARTGGSVIIFGLFMVATGVMFGTKGIKVLQMFPMPLLGVILCFEAFTLLGLISDVISNKVDLKISLLVAALSVVLPYGYIIGMITGIGVYYMMKLKKATTLSANANNN